MQYGARRLALGDSSAAAPRAAPELCDCVSDGDVGSDQKVETQAGYRIGLRGERSSRAQKVQPDVPQGVQSPTRYDPPYRAEQANPMPPKIATPTISIT